jgi:hypothetical protein
MKDLILDSAELKFVYDRTGIIDAAGGERGPGGGKDGKGGRKIGDAN